MFSYLWFTILYQPVFNALVWIYANLGEQNLGWSVVWLTVFLRVALLPLTIKSERDASKRQRSEEEAIEKSKAFKGDKVMQNEEIRRIMKKNRVSPWAKVIVLGVQLVMLVLLYQVFIGGIEGRKVISTLYPSIDYPGKLNTDFYGFEIGHRHDYVWAGIVGLYLILYILWSNRGKPWDTAKASFLILFPLFTFGALWFLPMVKSIFILTSMIFSDIIGGLMWLVLPKKKT